jgi:hypothetical protein
MAKHVAIVAKIVLALVWIAMAIFILAYPSAIGLSSPLSWRHAICAVGFTICVPLNIFVLWSKPKMAFLSGVGDKILTAFTVIFMWGCI